MCFGVNAAAWWGFHYKDLITEPKNREVITIYEIDAGLDRNWAQAVYNFQWTPQTDPFGVVHKTIDYPGVVVDHSTIKENHGVLKNVRVPTRPVTCRPGGTPPSRTRARKGPRPNRSPCPRP